jgi:hypothetical protein
MSSTTIWAWQPRQNHAVAARRSYNRPAYQGYGCKNRVYCLTSYADVSALEAVPASDSMAATAHTADMSRKHLQ